MKKIKLLALAFVIGTASIFATNVSIEKHSDKTEPIVKETSSNSILPNLKSEIKVDFFNEKFIVPTNTSKKVTQNEEFIHTLDIKAKKKKKKLKLLTNYYEMMPDIISKE